MSAEQVSGTPTEAEPAPSEVVDAALPEDSGDALEQAKKILQEAVDDGITEDDEPEDTLKADAEPEEKTDEPPAPEPESREAKVEQLKKILGSMSDHERAELLGTTDEAFAALRAKEKRAKKHIETAQSEREHLAKVRSELDELIGKAQSGPLEALEVLGWSLDDLVRYTESGQVPVERWQRSVEESVNKKLSEYEDMLAEQRHKANEMSWHSSVAQAVRQIPEYGAEHFPILAAKMKQGRISPEAVQQQVISAQANYFMQNRQTLALGDALRYLEGQLEHQRRLWQDENPDSQQAGAVKSAKTPEVSASEPLLTNRMAAERRSPQTSSTQDEMTAEQAIEEAKRLLFAE